ncbi:hypothetical protein FACS1894151_07160 [Spirochaetia bacterium]|nr:hypothetical protein FACS1894151_07160 [Spirochaetia bacterium]
MKKFLIVLLALALVGGFVFAQDAEAPKVKFTGSVNTGAVLTFKDGADSPTLRDENYNQGDTTRFQFTGNYTAENYGLNFEFKIHLTKGGEFVFPGTYPYYKLANGAELVLNNVYGWVELLDDVIKLSAGKITDVWGTGDDIWANYDAITGFRTEIKPVIGPGKLDVGFALPFWVSDPPLSYETPSGFDNLNPGFWNTVFGVSYDISGTFKAVAALKLLPDGNKFPNLLFAINLGDTAPVPGLKVVIDGTVEGLGSDVEHTTKFDLHEKFSLSEKLLGVTGLSAYIRFQELFDNKTNKDGDYSIFRLDINAQVAYKLTPDFTVGLYGGFRAYTDFAGSVIFLRPFLTYAFGPKATFGFRYNAEYYSDKTSGIGDNFRSLTGVTKHEIGCFFDWSFE